MMDEAVIRALSEHGPWVLLVFYMLYRDLEKDKIVRQVIEKNTEVLTELATIIRERLPGK
jgi:hypothetical protein